MTAVPDPSDDLRDLRSWVPSAAELADLELLLSGTFRPLTGFLGAADAATVTATGRLADGTPWPVPVTLTVPADLAEEERLVLQDPEGVPLAVLHVTEAWHDETGHKLAGRPQQLSAPAYGPFRRLRRTPDDVVAELVNASGTEPSRASGTEPSRASGTVRPVLAVATRTPLHRRRLGQLRLIAEKLEAQVLVLALMDGEHGDSLVRSLLAVPKELPPDATVIPIPLSEPADPGRDLLLRAHVAAAYGATHLLADEDAADAPVKIIVPEPWTYDTSVEVWRPAARVGPEHVRNEIPQQELDEMLDRGEPIPEWFTSPAVAQELRRIRPPKRERGLTVFFTGLSGSGKSTIARGLADALVERGRTVTLLDGDVVRRLLSAGLTFSKADRDLNIRRIGYAAAEVTRHGGVAICAPIAPYAATRAEVRRMVSALGDFVLVHVATPLEECERRDRKGLYAKARAGLIPEFTGISDPYEAPADADLVLDTSVIASEAAVNAVLDRLAAGGWVVDAL